MAIQRPQRTPVSRGRPIRPAAVAVTMVALVAAGVLGRLTEPHRTIGPTSAPPVASVSASVTASPEVDLVRLVSPLPNVLWFRSGLVRVRGDADGVSRIGATVTIGRRTIGQTAIDVDPDGRFAGWIPITPPATKLSAWLRLWDAADPDRLLVRTPLTVEAGDSVLIWTPTDPDLPLSGANILVTGPLLQGVGAVRVRLTDGAGRLISEATGPAMPAVTRGQGDPPGPGYRVELSIPADEHTGRSHLYVYALDARTGSVIDRADTRVTLGG